MTLKSLFGSAASASGSVMLTSTSLLPSKSSLSFMSFRQPLNRKAAAKGKIQVKIFFIVCGV